MLVFHFNINGMYIPCVRNRNTVSVLINYIPTAFFAVWRNVTIFMYWKIRWWKYPISLLLDLSLWRKLSLLTISSQEDWYTVLSKINLIGLFQRWEITPTRCRNSNIKQFCLDNIVPAILIILISHNYHSYTMGAYQNLISGDKRL